MYLHADPEVLMVPEVFNALVWRLVKRVTDKVRMNK